MLKSHRINGKMWDIQVLDFRNIYGLCDNPNGRRKGLIIQAGTGIKAIESLIHEALHAKGVPDEYLHKADGSTNTRDIGLLFRKWIKENIRELATQFIPEQLKD